MPALTDFISDATREDQQRLHEALLRGENLRWATRPIPTAWTRNTRPLLFFVPFIFAFLAFWTCGALGFPTSWAEVPAGMAEGGGMALFSIPFWLAGFWAASLPWQQKRRMRRDVYAVTDRRALIIRKKLIGWDTRAYPLSPELVIERHQRDGGSGDLLFEEEVHYHSEGNSSRWYGFFNLPDLSRAEAELEAALQARTNPKPN